MAIPEGFNEVEQLQMLVRRYINRQVREDFQDIGGNDWEPEIGTTRGAMRYALTHKDNDSLNVTLLRMFLYYFTYGKARQLQTPVYGIPTVFYQQEALNYTPQIFLHFAEDIEDVEPNYTRVYGELSFRLIGENHKTITETKLKSIATKIKSNFGGVTPFVWRKGKTKCNYTEPNKGYFLQILSRDVTAGKNLIDKVLDLQNHTPDWQYLNVKENQEPSQAYPTIPPSQTILGKTRRLPRRRPIADVKFTRAEAHIYGIAVPIILYDRTTLYETALVN